MAGLDTNLLLAQIEDFAHISIPLFNSFRDYKLRKALSPQKPFFISLD